MQTCCSWPRPLKKCVSKQSKHKTNLAQPTPGWSEVVYGAAAAERPKSPAEAEVGICNTLGGGLILTEAILILGDLNAFRDIMR